MREPPNGEENQGTDKVCVCVCSRVGQRGRGLKIGGPRKEERKVGERCHFPRQREQCCNCVHKTSSSTALLFEPFKFATRPTITPLTYQPSPDPSLFQATEEICFSSLSSPSASPSPIRGCRFFSSLWYLAMSEA